MNFGFLPFGKTTPPSRPATYRDAESGVVFYVESDGRHLAAIDRSGKLVWVVIPSWIGTCPIPYRAPLHLLDRAIGSQLRASLNRPV